MSQVVDQLEPVAAMRSVSVEPGFDDFSYRPLPPLAPVSLLLGLCAFSGWLSPLGLVFAIFGVILGIVAQRQICAADGGFSGKGLANAGVVLSALLFVSGVGLHIFWFATEVPEGFRRISFSTDISKKAFVIQNGYTTVHPDIAALNGEKLFVKGYMYPEMRQDGLESFILCRDNGACCFGGQPKLTDMIRVKMTEGQTVRHNPNLVSVAGDFRLNAGDVGELKPAFELDASYFSSAKTSY